MHWNHLPLAEIIRNLVCNESSEGRSWQGTGGVVQGTLFIFTRPCAPGIANSNQGVLTRCDIQGQGLSGESVHGSWKPLALLVTATWDLKYLFVLPLHQDLLGICEVKQPPVGQEFHLLRQWSLEGQLLPIRHGEGPQVQPVGHRLFISRVGTGQIQTGRSVLSAPGSHGGRFGASLRSAQGKYNCTGPC